MSDNILHNTFTFFLYHTNGLTAAIERRIFVDKCNFQCTFLLYSFL